MKFPAFRPYTRAYTHAYGANVKRIEVHQLHHAAPARRSATTKCREQHATQCHHALTGGLGAYIEAAGIGEGSKPMNVLAPGVDDHWP
jgi:hypothetical protein